MKEPRNEIAPEETTKYQRPQTEAQRRAGVACELSADDLHHLPMAVETDLYRVAQEAWC